MNQKLISGLTATLLITTLSGLNYRSSAEASPAVSQAPEADQNASSPPPHSPIGNVVKVGEQQSQTPSSEDSIAKIQPHEHAGRKAATLYVRNIPVLTFIGSQSASSNGVKMGATQTDESSQTAKLKSGSVSAAAPSSDQRQNSTQTSQLDPVTRATEIAAKLNQLYRQGVDAKTITVRWKQAPNGTGDRYIIEANKTTIVAVDADTILPDTTKNPGQDALQVTNRLRRLIGDAAPLKDVPNKPNNGGQQISLGPIKLRIMGWASWYGPGFDGNASASGETFNQNAMTAAHRSLPFGTQVQVTNLDNGRSVVVRINDRGPYVGDRVIDLSAGAARILGVIQSGIAPVRLEVMSSRRVVSSSN
ncbi:MAG: septal ring lytic transglycosylase RlpA family protein [Phormidesmis sp. CAN_BIN36]|nr:septal ring lytic transglycosylase RlpA family protein [Phormidesmis sp. CAN_BIN36]